jgi:hypothetical protein
MIVFASNICSNAAWFCDLQSWIDSGYKVLVPLIAALALIYTARNFSTNRGAQHFANAVQMYRKYLELAVTYPTFAEPDEYPPIVDRVEFGRYEWFLGILIRACEELLEFRRTLDAERRKEWRRTVESLLRNHKTYFNTNEWYNKFGKTIYSREFVEWVERIKAEPD